MDHHIDISEYSYDLPTERIALYPPDKRGNSRLLVYQGGIIHHQKFSQLPDFLKDNSLLVVNNTRVIPARLLFPKSSGAVIEIFLLTPILPSPLVQVAMTALHTSTWKCTIGNLKRWKDDALILNIGQTSVTAELIDRNSLTVKFSWTGDLTFSEVIEAIGKTPLPPYLKRDVNDIDKERYQTVYAKYEGAVAAPTAGLHLTDDVLDQLKKKNIIPAYVTLHVGAGTFMPVKVSNAVDHVMHEEQIVVTKELLENLSQQRHVIAVGTTSMRVLESIYWFGCKLANDPNAEFLVTQADPYGSIKTLSLTDSLDRVVRRLGSDNQLTGRTSIYIRPGYTFHVVNSLITNFHQPGSTLMLLVAAFVGPAWKYIYDQALSGNYQFLSYGDSSLLHPTPLRGTT